MLLSGSFPEDSGSSALQTTTKMASKSGTYLPVPGDEKTPDEEFVNPKAESKESIVRDRVFLLATHFCKTATLINEKTKMLEFCKKKKRK